MLAALPLLKNDVVFVFDKYSHFTLAPFTITNAYLYTRNNLRE